MCMEHWCSFTDKGKPNFSEKPLYVVDLEIFNFAATFFFLQWLISRSERVKDYEHTFKETERKIYFTLNGTN